MEVKCLNNTVDDYKLFSKISQDKISIEKFNELVELFKIFLLEENGKSIGYAVIAILPSFAEIEEFYIIPSARGLGKGSYLFNKIETIISSMGIKEFRLFCVNNASIFWEKMGFTFNTKSLCTYIKKIP